jgi:ABC-type transport system involved in multi-copper enzyme maturation permease subunit
MPVYDYSYKVWQGRRLGPLFRWLAIPKFAYMELVKLRWFTSLLTIAAIHFILRLGYIYLFVNDQLVKGVLGLFIRGRADFNPLDAIPQIDAWFFQDAINYQLPLCFILTFVMGANLISRDLKHNAVVLYASKPISRWEYFLGKFSVLFLIFITMLGVLPLTLFGAQTLIAPDHSAWHLKFWENHASIGPSILIYSLIVASTLSLLMMTASCLTKNARYAGITFAIFIIGAGVLSELLAVNMNNVNYHAISPYESVLEVGDYVFGMNEGVAEDARIAPTYAWGAVIGYCLLCLSIIDWRIKNASRYGR